MMKYSLLTGRNTGAVQRKHVTEGKFSPADSISAQNAFFFYKSNVTSTLIYPALRSNTDTHRHKMKRAVINTSSEKYSLPN